jgi:hypothetical protein
MASEADRPEAGTLAEGRWRARVRNKVVLSSPQGRDATVVSAFQGGSAGR